MADIKQASFMLLILLVAISGMYEWAKEDPILGEQLGIGPIEDFTSTVLLDKVGSIEFQVGNVIQSAERVDIIGFILALVNILIIIIVLFSKLLFGWVLLIDAVFSTAGLEGLKVIFIGPIAIIQLLGLFYFLRDLVTAVRGLR